MLEHMGLRPEIRQVLAAHPERIYSLWRSHVHAAAAAIVVEQKGLARPGAPLFVDVVWHQTSRLLLDSLGSMSLQLSVMRLERNQKALEDGAVLGSASFSLEELLTTHQSRFEGLLPLGSNREALRTLAHLQVRLRLHALSTPPEARLDAAEPIGRAPI